MAMKCYYSILRLFEKGGKPEDSIYVVCETAGDEAEVIKMAAHERYEIAHVISNENCGYGIYLNEFPL